MPHLPAILTSASASRRSWEKRILTVLTIGLLSLQVPLSFLSFHGIAVAATLSSGGGTSSYVGKTDFVTLDDLVLTSDNAGDIDTTGVTLQAGSNLEFDTGTTPTTGVTGTLTAGIVSVTANTISVTITANASAGDTLTLHNIRVRASSGAASGSTDLSITSNGGTIAAAAIPVDVTAPSVTSFTVAGATLAGTTYYTNNQKPTVTVDYTDAGAGIDTTSTLLRLNTLPNPSTTTRSTTELSYTPSSNLIAGTYSLSFDTKDTVKNAATTVSKSLVIDTTAPAAPAITSPSTGTTASNQTPTVSGTTEANATVKVYADASLVATTTADGSGNYSVATSSLASGSHSLTATATDRAGNTSVASSAVTYTVDITAPTVPTLTTQADTNNLQPTLSWSDESASGATSYQIQVSTVSNFASTVVDQTQAGTSFTPGSNLPVGLVYWHVRASDAYGNWSAYSGTGSFTIDTTAPTVTSVVLSDPSPTKAGAVTATITFSKPLNTAITPTVTLGSSTSADHATSVSFSTGTTVTADFTVPANGSWDGTNTFAISGATDPATNVMALDTTHTFVIDTQNPVVSVTGPTTGAVYNTAAGTATITWSATDVTSGVANSIALEYSTNGSTYTSIATGETNDGTYTWTLPAGLDSNTVTIRVTATDLAGNSASAVSGQFTVDTQAPANPAGSVTPSSPSSTNFLTVNGTTDSQASTVTVVLTPTSGPTHSQTVAVSSNAYTATFSGLGDSHYDITAQATDSHGNVSGVTTVTTGYIIDTTAPTLVGSLSPATGSSTNNTMPTITGTFTDGSGVGLDGASLDLTIDGLPMSGATFSALTGIFSFTPSFPLDDGTYTAEVTAADTLGQVSALASTTFTISTAPIITSATATGGTVVASYVNATNTGYTISGTVPADTAGAQSVELFLNGAPFSPAVTTTVAQNATAFSFTLSPAAYSSLTGSAGVQMVTARRTGYTGEVSGYSGATSVTIDLVAPSQPAGGHITLNQNAPGSADTLSSTAGAVVTGDAATVALYHTSVTPANLLTSEAPNPDGSFATLSLGDNAYDTFDLVAVDLAGNQSTPLVLSNDIVAPTAPNLTAPLDNTFSQNATPTVSGTAEANATVTVYQGATLVATTTATGAGTFSVATNPLGSDASYSLTAVATDAAGNFSPASSAVTYTLDRVAPAISSVTLTNTTVGTTQYAKNGDTVVLTATITDANQAGITTGDITADLSALGGGAAVAPTTYAAGTATWTGLAVTGSGTATVTLHATDQAANTGTGNGSILVDNTAPTSLTVTDDGAYQASTSQFHAMWSASDPESSIASYSYAIGTTAGGTDVVGKTGIGTATSVTATGLSLTEGTSYYLTVYAVNGAGAESSLSSDGIIPDVTAPSVPGSVTDDGSYTKVATSLHASWTASTDTTSGLAHYSVAVGTTPGGHEVTSFTTVGTVTDYTVTGLSLSTGTVYYFSVEAVDNAGNTSGVGTSDGVLVDTVAPVVNTITPAGSTSDPNAVITVSWTEANSGFAADPTRSFLLNGIPVDTTWNAGTQTMTYTPAAPLVSGTYSFTASIDDRAGNTGTTSSTLKLDLEAPTGTVTISGTPTYTNTPNVTLDIASSDPNLSDATAGSGVAQMEIGQLSNLSDASYQAIATTLPFTLAAGEGLKTLYARFKDAAGNESPILTFANIITLDTIAPVLTVGTPVPTPGNVATPSLTFTSTEAGSITYGGACTSSTTTAAVGSNPITFTALADGTYTTCTVQVTDAAGNPSLILAVPAFTIDTVAPVVTVSTLVTSDTTPALTGTVDDTTAAISVTVNGSTYAATNNGDGTWTLADNTVTALTTNQQYDVAVSATDPAGNIGTDSTTNELTVDSTAPVTTLTSSPVTADGTGGWFKTTPQITLSALDNLSGVASIHYQIDAGSITAYTVPFSLSDGTHTVHFWATDNAGNLETTQNATFTVDTIAPATISSVDLGSTITSNKAIGMTWTSPTETGSGIDHYLLTIRQDTASGTVVEADRNLGNVLTWTLDAGEQALLSEHTYVFGIAAVDAAGNQGTYQYSNGITVDQTAPASPSISINAGATWATSQNVTLTLNAQDGFTPVQMMVSNHSDLSADGTNGDSGTWIAYATSKAWDVGSGDGSKMVYVKYRDGGDNETSIINASITLDTTAPTAPVITPLVGTQTNVVSFSGTAEAASTVNISLSDGVHTPITLSRTADGSGNWSVSSLSVAALNDGTITISATATDAAGNVSTAGTTTFTKDGTAPVFSSLLASPSNVMPGATVSLTFTTSEALSGQPTVTVNGMAATYQSLVGSTYTYSYVTSGSDPEGAATISISGSDLVGNIGSLVNTTALHVDSTAPSITSGQAITTGAYTAHRPHVQVQITDTNSGVATGSLVMRINGFAVTTSYDAGTGILSFDPPRDLAARSYIVTVNAHDNAGNNAARYTFSFTVL